MPISGIPASPAAGISQVLTQLRAAQARTQSALGGASPATAGASPAASTGGLRGTLKLSADESAEGVGGAGGTGGTGFGAALKASLDQVSTSQMAATSLGQKFEKGEGNVDLNDVMIAMQKANVSFQGAIQVRNRVVAAYNEIMNMQI